jgi:Right handed beta helix region
MLRITVVLASLLSILTPAVATATSQRTFVASYGNDGNACSLVAPCRTFGAAMAQTNPSGEIIVVDSAGYGPMVITQSITVTAPAGIHAGISVISGDGVTVVAPNIVVTLRGLTIAGQGGLNGIVFTSGKHLIVDRCTISNMLLSGILLQTLTAASATLTNVRVENSQQGVWVNDNVRATITDSQFSNGSNGIVVSPEHSFSPAEAYIGNIVVDHYSNAGIFVQAQHSAAIAQISGSQIVRNAVGISALLGALVYATDNRIFSNDGYGVFQFGLSSVVLSNNVISLTRGSGVSQSDAGHVYTMKNNIVHDNVSNISNGPLVQLTLD